MFGICRQARLSNGVVKIAYPPPAFFVHMPPLPLNTPLRVRAVSRTRAVANAARRGRHHTCPEFGHACRCRNATNPCISKRFIVKSTRNGMRVIMTTLAGLKETSNFGQCLHRAAQHGRGGRTPSCGQPTRQFALCSCKFAAVREHKPRAAKQREAGGHKSMSSCIPGGRRQTHGDKRKVHAGAPRMRACASRRMEAG